MQIFDFDYIINTKCNGILHDRINNFYVTNNKLSTLEHVTSVAQTNIEIAKRYDLDIVKCELSGKLHDISVVMQPKDMIVFAKARGIILDESEIKYPFLLHQQISQVFAIELFDIKDNEILTPIACHTTLKNNPSKYEMALFIADKLSWDQNGKPPFFDLVNDALEISLEYASLQYINFMINQNMILYPHQWFIQAKKYLENVCSE